MFSPITKNKLLLYLKEHIQCIDKESAKDFINNLQELTTEDEIKNLIKIYGKDKNFDDLLKFANYLSNSNATPYSCFYKVKNKVIVPHVGVISIFNNESKNVGFMLSNGMTERASRLTLPQKSIEEKCLFTKLKEIEELFGYTDIRDKLMALTTYVELCKTIYSAKDIDILETQKSLRGRRNIRILNQLMESLLDCIIELHGYKFNKLSAAKKAINFGEVQDYLSGNRD